MATPLRRCKRRATGTSPVGPDLIVGNSEPHTIACMNVLNARGSICTIEVRVVANSLSRFPAKASSTQSRFHAVLQCSEDVGATPPCCCPRSESSAPWEESGFSCLSSPCPFLRLCLCPCSSSPSFLFRRHSAGCRPFPSVSVVHRRRRRVVGSCSARRRRLPDWYGGLAPELGPGVETIVESLPR